MRYFLATILWFFYAINICSQSAIPDSISQHLAFDKEDTNKVKLLLRAAILLPYYQPDSGLYYSDSVINISDRINFSWGKAFGLRLKAEALMYQGNYSQSIFYNSQSIELYKRIQDQSGINNGYAGLLQNFLKLGDFAQALAYSVKSNKIVLAWGDSVYNRLYETIESTAHYKMLCDFALAKIYLAAGFPDSTIYYGLKALKRDQETRKIIWSAQTAQIGNAYLKLHDYSNALKYFNLKADPEFSIAIDSLEIMNGKAEVFREMNNMDSCEYFARLAWNISIRGNFLEGRMKAADVLAKIFENSNPKESIKYLRTSLAIKDSLFGKEKINQINTILFNEQIRKLDAESAKREIAARLKIWILVGSLATLLICGFLMWRNVMHKKKANELLEIEKAKIEKAYSELKATQQQLIQSEKMASLGELTAGIAHEIQNPLNFVNNFSEVNDELIKELKAEAEKGNLEDVKAIANNIAFNSEKINHHGKRADSIVKGMLQHSRTSTGQKEPTDINALAEEYLRLAYHGLKAKDKSFNATTKTDFDNSVGKINVVSQDIGRVILNLINNAFYAVDEKKKQLNDGYEPIVSVSTKKDNGKVEIRVADNGNGIPQKVLDKIFQPFFTTKPTGQGTGLGLSLAYDIVTKGHGGELRVETKEGVGSEFIIQLP